MQQKCVIFLLKNRKTITEKPFFLIFSPVSLIIIIIKDRRLCCIEGELMIGELLREKHSFIRAYATGYLYLLG